MKFILCPYCMDLHFLTTHQVRTCRCGKTHGKYNEDGDTVTISKDARLYGLLNTVFTTGQGKAFIYPDLNGKVTRV